MRIQKARWLSKTLIVIPVLGASYKRALSPRFVFEPEPFIITDFEFWAASCKLFLEQEGYLQHFAIFCSRFCFLQFEAVAVVQNFSTQLGTLSNLVNNTCHIKQEFWTTMNFNYEPFCTACLYAQNVHFNFQESPVSVHTDVRARAESSPWTTVPRMGSGALNPAQWPPWGPRDFCIFVTYSLSVVESRIC